MGGCGWVGGWVCVCLWGGCTCDCLGRGGPIFQNAQHLLNITLHIFEIHSLEILNPQKKKLLYITKNNAHSVTAGLERSF